MTRFDTDSRHGRIVVAATYAALVAAFLLGYALLFAGVKPIVPDSRGYLYFSPDRTIGYQLFLALLGRISANLVFVQAAQLLAVGASVLLAAYAFFRRTGSALAGACVLLLTLGYPAPMKSVMQVTTEGLSMACAALFAAIYLTDARRARGWTIPALAVLLFVATTIRPTNPGLLLGGLLALWLCRRHGRRAWRAAAILIAGVLLGLIASPLAYRWLAPGRPGDSAAARGLFGAALLAPGRGDAAARACGAPPFDAALQPVKEYIAAAPPRIAGYLRLQYVNYLRFDRTIPQIMAARDLRLRAEANPIMMCYARARLLDQPGYFIGRVAHSYWSLASYENYDQPAFNRRLTAFLEKSPAPLPSPIAFPADPDAGLHLTAPWQTGRKRAAGRDKDAPNPLKPQEGRNVWLTRALSAVLLASTALGLVALLAASFRRWRRPAIVDMAVFAIVIQAVLVVSSVFEIPLMRYLYPLWPLIALVLLRPVPGLLCRAGARRTQGGVPA